MAWWDDMVKAEIRSKFATASLRIDSVQKSGGRRTQAHEFADVDGAWVEDSGGKPARFEIQAFLVGDNYHVDLQDLEFILEAPGPLELDIPSRGTVGNLWLDGDFSSSESAEDLGHAQVTFTLVQSKAPSPLIFEALASQMAVKAAVVFSAAESAFLDEWSGDDVRGSGTRGLARIASVLNSTYQNILAKFGPISSLSKSIADFQSSLNTLAGLPGAITAKVRGLIRQINSLTAKKAKDVGRRPFGYGAPLDVLTDAAQSVSGANQTPEAIADEEAVTSGASGQGQGQNQQLKGEALIAKTDLDALQVFIGSNAVAGLAEVLAVLELPTAEAAQALSQVIQDLADEVMGLLVAGSPISQELYESMFDLKITAVNLLAELKGGLPSLGIYTVPVTMPLVILAYSQAGDTGPELDILIEEIIENNAIEWPMAIPMGTEIKVVGA